MAAVKGMSEGHGLKILSEEHCSTVYQAGIAIVNRRKNNRMSCNRGTQKRVESDKWKVESKSQG
jgi:hypothetical protein